VSERFFFSLLAAAVLAVATWLLQATWRRQEAGPPQAHTPDYYATGLQVTAMDERGKPRHRLKARKMRHYDDTDTTELETPDLVIYDPERPPWEVMAESGWISPDGEEVLLRGEVVITRPEGPKAQALRIVTRDLRVYPDKDYAETDEHVEMFSRDHWMESVGARVWFEEPVRIKFLSQVRGRHEIKQP
jgi:lipopolysaccharide export system protein LptC